MWQAIIPAALSVMGSVVQYNSSNRQNKNQLAWNKYNAQMAYNVDMANVDAGVAIGMMNAGMQMAAGRANAQMEIMGGEFNARMIEDIARYNAALIQLTTDYNTSLLEDELSMMWEAANLDLLHLENQRAVERGQIEGQQAASGVLMGQDSNADVIVSQQTQAALDSFVVRHNANREAEAIRIKIDENIFNGTLAWQQTMYQGATEAFMTRTNARIRAAGIAGNAALNAAATAGQAQIQGMAGRMSARYALDAGLAGAQMNYNQNRTQIKNNLVSGLFGAAQTGFTLHYMMKQPPVSNPFTSNVATQTYSTATRSASQLARANHSAWERVLRGQITEPGSPLL